MMNEATLIPVETRKMRSALPSGYVTAEKAGVHLNKSKMTITRWLKDPEIKDTVFPKAYQDGPTARSPWAIALEDINEYLRSKGLEEVGMAAV